jgi:hypothetical protein
VIALGLIVAFMAVAVVVGALVHSLALLSDAAHIVTDAGTTGLSLFAIRLAARPAKGAMTYGEQARRDPVGAIQLHHAPRARPTDRLRGGHASHPPTRRWRHSRARATSPARV